MAPKNLMRLKTYAATRPTSVMTLRRRIAAGDITGYRVGPKLLMIDADEADQVLFNKRIPTIIEEAKAERGMFRGIAGGDVG